MRLDVAERRLKNLVLLLVREDIEALHEGQSRVDHRRELAREDDDLLRFHPGTELEGRERTPFFHLDRVELLLAQARLDRGLVVGLHHSFSELAGARPRLPRKICHRPL
jgi:hypothetical protein